MFKSWRISLISCSASCGLSPLLVAFVSLRLRELWQPSCDSLPAVQVLDMIGAGRTGQTKVRSGRLWGRMLQKIVIQSAEERSSFEALLPHLQDLPEETARDLLVLVNLVNSTAQIDVCVLFVVPQAGRGQGKRKVDLPVSFEPNALFTRK